MSSTIRSTSSATPSWLTDRPITQLRDHPVAAGAAPVAAGAAPVAAGPARRRPANELEQNAVREFVDRARPWSVAAAPLHASTTAALWAVGLVNVPLLVWAVAVLTGKVECSGWACTIGTFGHPGLLLALSGTCVAGLAAAAVCSRGLTRAGAVPLSVMGVSGVCGVIAPMGVIAVVVIVLVTVALALAVLAILVDR